MSERTLFLVVVDGNIATADIHTHTLTRVTFDHLLLDNAVVCFLKKLLNFQAAVYF